MKRIRIDRPRIQRERAWAEDLPADPRDRDVIRPPGTLGRPDGSAEQMQHVFHELHAEGRHDLCEVCAYQYRQ